MTTYGLAELFDREFTVDVETCDGWVRLTLSEAQAVAVMVQLQDALRR